jgi:hypothetical protein
MEIVLRQMKAAWDWARDTKSTPNTSNQASGSVKRKHEDEAASRKRLRDNMQGEWMFLLSSFCLSYAEPRPPLSIYYRQHGMRNAYQ